MNKLTLNFPFLPVLFYVPINKLVKERGFPISLMGKTFPPVSTSLNTTYILHGIGGACAEDSITLLKEGVNVFMCQDGPCQVIRTFQCLGGGWPRGVVSIFLIIGASFTCLGWTHSWPTWGSLWVGQSLWCPRWPIMSRSVLLGLNLRLVEWLKNHC